MIENLLATETSFGNPALPTLKIDVVVRYKNRVFKANSFVFPYSQEDSDHPDFFFDEPESKQSVISACHFINQKVNEHLRGKELPLNKNMLTGLTNWFNRVKHKESSGELFKCSPFAIKAVAEALMSSYGSIKNPETPAIAQYEQFSMKKFPADGNPESLKFMFSLFNGGKALGSKVKIAKFYLILNYELQDVQEGGDALAIYHRVAAGIKKGLQSHKLGENAFKPTPGGQYFNAHENHNETFKVIEDAINQSGANVSFPEV